MIAIETQIIGAEDLRDRIRQLPIGLQLDVTVDGMLRAGRVIRTEARSRIRPHRRTGNLERGIRVLRKRGRRATMILVASTARHSHLVELGHGGPKPAPPHPYLRESAAATLDEQVREFRIGAERRLVRVVEELTLGKLSARSRRGIVI